MPLEFNEADPRALHVATVVQTFESSFRLGYLYRRFGGTAGTPLFRDFYGHPTITVSKGPPDPDWLFLIDILDKKKRVEALWQLCVRVAPKLWPDLYAGSFQARRVRSLRHHQSQLTALYRAEIERIDAQAEEEERFFGPFYNLLYVGDEALVDLVMKVFTEVLHCHTENLDEQVTPDEWRTLDLRVRCGAWDAFVEVKGSTNRNAKIADLEQLDDHYETASTRYGQAKSKILIFNGKYGRPEDERLRDATFSSHVIDEAITRSITLVDTRDLLDAIDRIRNGELREQKLTGCLRTPGRLALPAGS